MGLHWELKAGEFNFHTADKLGETRQRNLLTAFANFAVVAGGGLKA